MAQHQYSDISGYEATPDTRTSQEEDLSLELLESEHNHVAKDVHLASISEKKRLWWRNAVINSFYILSWFSFATILSVYNKWMFSKDRYGFPAPLFVTTMHMFVQFALSTVLRYTWPAHFRPTRSPTLKDYGQLHVGQAVAFDLHVVHLPPVTLPNHPTVAKGCCGLTGRMPYWSPIRPTNLRKAEVMKKAIPTAVATSLDIGLSNLSLKTITLSFYTMCKSSSLIFVLSFAFLFRLEIFSWRLIGVILLIFSGVLLMVATETHFFLEGFLLVITASAMGGLRWSLTQIMLKNKKLGFDNPAATIYWLSPAMGICLAIVSLIVEGWSSLFQSRFFSGFSKILETLVFLSAPGVVAFCMVLSEFYIIQRVGVVPMSIAGIAKEVTTISISSWFFGDQLTPLNIVGVAITVCGIALFTFHKYLKSLDSNIPLDAHGNPVTGEDDDADYAGEANGRAAPEEERIRLTSEAEIEDDFRETASSRGESQVLFSADDGDEDADELRSLRSSKFRWKANSSSKAPSEGAARLEEASAIVARESMELERMWTRDHT
ncbi:hypothetical protein NP233_g4922 [Leucocoprinus birnbaumii]|uniref:Sugar phosphate transporter domain-containing protein n=1 Tax=Leucocoprinus birnbaumii TaxID=56174 RepID=A0AAD5VWH0_9AGAR|nr:hypothetical protein NP233_g4922 [Leucocoprinus birnbaumii]